MTTDTRNAGNIAATEKRHMENARRNVKICERKQEGEAGKDIAMQYGLAASTVSVIINQGLEYWQEWERKAIEAGIIEEETQVSSDGGIVMLPIWEIEDNPWEPRSDDLNENKLMDLAVDVYRNGLLSPILVRPRDGRHQRVFGKRRLEAFRYWDALAWDAGLGDNLDEELSDVWAALYYDGKTTRIPAIVRDMTDEEVILASLSENSKREDLSWLEETRAFRQALDADVGLSQRRLAATVGISPTNLSTRLSMLRLPSAVLELVDQEKLAWTTARELLGFVSSSHIHQEELDYVARALPRSRVIKDGRVLSRDDVKQFMLNAMNHNECADKWEHLDPDTRWMFLGNSGKEKDTPKFDIEAFVDEHFDFLHTLPGKWATGTMTWTCKGEEWRKAQSEALAAEEQATNRERSATEARSTVAAATLPTPDEVPTRCWDNDGEHTWRPRHASSTCRQFLCPQCGLTYERSLPPTALSTAEPDAQPVSQQSEPEPAAQLQDMAMAAVPEESVPSGNAPAVVDLSEEAFEALYAVYENLEAFYADENTPPSIEDVNSLCVGFEKARNALMPYMQAPLAYLE